MNQILGANYSFRRCIFLKSVLASDIDKGYLGNKRMLFGLSLGLQKLREWYIVHGRVRPPTSLNSLSWMVSGSYVTVELMFTNFVILVSLTACSALGQDVYIKPCFTTIPDRPIQARTDAGEHVGCRFKMACCQFRWNSHLEK